MFYCRYDDQIRGKIQGKETMMEYSAKGNFCCLAISSFSPYFTGQKRFKKGKLANQFQIVIVLIPNCRREVTIWKKILRYCSVSMNFCTNKTSKSPNNNKRKFIIISLKFFPL